VLNKRLSYVNVFGCKRENNTRTSTGFHGAICTACCTP
jgi:hypothetical protein